MPTKHISGSDEARSDWSWTLSSATQTDVPKSSCPVASTTDHEVVLCATHVTGSHHGDWDGNVSHVNLKPGECFDEVSHRKPRNLGGYKAPSNVNCRMPAGIQASVPQHYVLRLLLSPWVANALTPYNLAVCLGSDEARRIPERLKRHALNALPLTAPHAEAKPMPLAHRFLQQAATSSNQLDFLANTNTCQPSTSRDQMRLVAIGVGHCHQRIRLTCQNHPVPFPLPQTMKSCCVQRTLLDLITETGTAMYHM